MRPSATTKIRALVILVASLVISSSQLQISLANPVSTTSTQSVSSATAYQSASSTESPLAADLLNELSVKGRAPKTGYSRAEFGQAWADVDRNGCDTRNDILKRDLTNLAFKAKTRNCVVLSGILNDPYSGERIEFLRGEKTSELVQIDHIVALSNAWQTGAFQKSLSERTQLANDPLNLLAVKGALNSQKGDGDAATWLPPLKSFRCEYVARQIAVKKKYQLWVTNPEKEAMVRILKSCPNQRV